MFNTPKKDITDTHLNIIRSMLEEALTKAAVSMEQMLRVRMKYELMDFGVGILEPIEELDRLGRFKVNVLKVAFKGEIQGAFYFMINVHETQLINTVCLPESVNTTRNSEASMMKHDFMTEIENLIASMSITELAEFLGAQIDMQVPQMNTMKGEEVNKYLEKENELNNTRFFVKSTLNGIAVNISPYFIWMLDDKFIRITSQNIVT